MVLLHPVKLTQEPWANWVQEPKAKAPKPSVGAGRGVV